MRNLRGNEVSSYPSVRPLIGSDSDKAGGYSCRTWPDITIIITRFIYGWLSYLIDSFWTWKPPFIAINQWERSNVEVGPMRAKPGYISLLLHLQTGHQLTVKMRQEAVDRVETKKKIFHRKYLRKKKYFTSLSPPASAGSWTGWRPSPPRPSRRAAISASLHGASLSEEKVSEGVLFPLGAGPLIITN